VKKGAYADDVGLVEAYDNIKNLVEVKLIPRVDFEQKKQQDMDDGTPTRLLCVICCLFVCFFLFFGFVFFLPFCSIALFAFCC
jgi:hypothetical protein